MTELDVADLDLANAPPRGDVILITDATAEGEVVASALRARDYHVVDAPLALLEARTLAVSPRIIIVDVDQLGALEAVERLRELSPGAAAELLCIGDSTRAAELGATLAARRAFERPVALDDLLAAVAAMAEPWQRDARARGAALSPSYASLRQTRPLSSSARGSELPPPVSDFPGADPLDVMSIFPATEETETGTKLLHSQLSPELSRLLEAAIDRVTASAAQPSSLPVPGEEVDLLLPPELLAVLDEPLEPEDDGSGTGAGGTGTGGGGTGGGIGTYLGTGAIAHSGMPPPQARKPRTVELPQPITSLGPGAGGTGSGGASAGTVGAGSGGPASGTGGTGSGIPQELDPEADASGTEGAFAAGPPETRPALSLGASRTRDDPPPAELVESAWSPPSAARGVDRGDDPPLTSRHDAPPFAFGQAPPAQETVGAAQSSAPSRSDEWPAERVALAAPPPASGTAPSPPATRPRFGGPAASPHDDPPDAPSLGLPPVLYDGDALRAFARAVGARASGSLAVGPPSALRRIVLHDGDVVTAGSGSPDETLLAFLIVRGDLGRDAAARLAGKLPPFGRHAGAALVAHGHLGQDELWPVLRAHAEWIIGHAVMTDEGTCDLEVEPPGRLKAEPNVFGGATGAEVLIETVRRVLPPDAALHRLGGPTVRLDEGSRHALLAECALRRDEEERVRASRGRTVAEVIEGADPELASVLAGLVALEVLETLAPAAPPERATPSEDPLDEEALRARVRARVALVEDGDYFAVLGVARAATGYEIRRAYLALRRAFEPSRLLTAATADLGPDVHLVLTVLDEAYDILREPNRRERYRKAIEGAPPA